MSGIQSVAVLGSCITRDNFNSRFNPQYKRWFRVGPTTNQSSMIALMSPPVDEEWKPVNEMTRYGRWNVASDLSREILGLLRNDPPDLLVLDFFGDVHFGVLRMPDGRYVTDNRWRLHKTDLYRRLLEDERTTPLRWQQDPDGYLANWTEAMDRFATYVAEHCPGTTVVVHCGFNAVEVMEPGRDLPQRMKPRGRPPRPERRAGNAFWDRLNAHAGSAYGWETIDLREEYYVTYTEHPWGPFAVHYTLDYYHRFLAELHRVALRRELSAELSSRVDLIAAASADRVRAERTYWQDAEQLAQPAGSRRKGLARRVRETLGRHPGHPVVDDGEDHHLLEALRGRVDTDTWERVAQLPASADEHVAWLRRVGEARLAHSPGTGVVRKCR